MKRLSSLVVVVFAFAALVVASAFGAGGKSPHNQPITATCTTSGNVTVHASSGQFTPAVGTAGPVFTKVYGHKNGLVKRNTAQSCKGSQTDAAGNTFTFTVTVAKTTR